ncbi:MAG: hypothetical protein ACTS1X_02560 [Parasphingopyxis sp.]|uniref:hypothetical protein n=1 Tax=Parasphingopyxis sp. TaxID=1920299 RepID=UPI003F9F8CAD
MTNKKEPRFTPGLFLFTLSIGSARSNGVRARIKETATFAVRDYRSRDEEAKILAASMVALQKAQSEAHKTAPSARWRQLLALQQADAFRQRPTQLRPGGYYRTS